MVYQAIYHPMYTSWYTPLGIYTLCTPPGIHHWVYASLCTSLGIHHWVYATLCTTRVYTTPVRVNVSYALPKESGLIWQKRAESVER